MVDQYGRPWSEVGSNQSMKSPLTGDRILPETQALLNPLGIGIAPLNEDINPIPFEYIIDYYKQIKNGVENPNIDILSLGKGPLSYEGAKSYIENDPRYMLLLNNGSNPLLLPEVELLSPLPKEEKTLIESESIKSELDDSNWISTARYEKVTVTTIDENIDLTLGFGLVSIGHTQKVTKIISNGEEGIVFGAYVYTDIHADNIEGIGNEAGLGLTLLDTLGFEIYAKVIGIGAKLSIKKDNFSLFANLDINLVDDVTASIGYVNKLKNGDEVEDSYEIRGNIFAVIAVIYFIYTGAEMPAGAQPNGGKIPGLN